MKSSNVQWVELRELISRSDERNTGELYTLDDLRGISIQKKFIDSKANMDGVSLAPYKLVKPNYFCYVTITSRNSDKITLALNMGSQTYIVSSSYEVFYVSDEQRVLPEYIYLWFSRPEFDRYARFNSWGSAREAFAYEDMERVRIPLPSIDEQRTIVDAWKSLRNIKEQNESLSAPIMQLCSSYLQECKHKFPIVELSPYIEECNNRNKELEFGESDLMGVKSDGTFIMSIADKSELKFHNYKIVRRGEFSYSNRINIGSIAMNRVRDCIVSPSYAVFKVKDDCLGTILPDYLDMWYRRSEFLRSTLFFAFGTIKDDFSIENMKRSRVPLPPIDVQRAIVSLYQCALEYKAIAAEADEQAKKICSPLLQQLIHQS